MFSKTYYGWKDKENIGVMGRREMRRMQLLDDLETRECWKFKEEVLFRTLWGSRFGRGYGPVVKQITVL